MKYSIGLELLGEMISRIIGTHNMTDRDFIQLNRFTNTIFMNA
jgi:hypothetical protein